MAIASLGGMSPAPTELTIGKPRSGLGGGMGGGMGGGTAQDGLAQVNSGAQTAGMAIGQAAQALGASGMGGASSANPADVMQSLPMAMKKGGAVKSKSRGSDWHGFGKSGTGKNNHGF